ncbi:protein ELYS-like isoform X4 [Portunus trituberculatus]|uniref:protein ELYS-like isoform X4 n=1 Tax=Portunus trituberculatus TaxID=210409 RepID=UPI001E1CB886|nr:protein ELYS-like isoform X4 [Portunus trituberculatus]
MVGVSVVQVANAVRHTPLPSLASDADTGVGPEDPVKGLDARASPAHVLGGFVGEGQLAWRASGPTVEIIDPDRGTRKAAWTFGAVLHNTGAEVTSVCGVGKAPLTHVVVGVDLGADRRPRGLVALLSLRSSRVTRAFHFEHKVTSLCMGSGGELTVDSGTLAPELRHWHGLLVVGTAHGTLHLLDLALDLGAGHKVLSDEVSPGTLLAMATPDPNAEHSRVSTLVQKCHPTMCLSDGMSYGGHFQLIGPDDNVLFEVASQQVFVAALAFFPQLASLVVGYNFGAFQIINLSTLTIDCASPYEESMPPVLSFACQEPENDPKNFVYLWLCRSWTSEGGREKSKTGQGSRALCTMYAMNYDSKVWIEGHGLWYQGLASISPRFEFDILGGLGLRGQPVEPSRVFSALTVQLSTPPSAAGAGGPSPVGALTASDEDSGSVLEQSLCLFGWVGGVKDKGYISLNHYLAVFDINQWYQAHMPSSLKLEESHLCPYMSFHLLDRVPGINADGTLSEVVMGAIPKPASWAQHTSHTCNDSDWFPAALSYDALVLTSDSLVEYRCQSAQQAALALLTSCGPAAIVNPEEAHAVCVFAGLIPSDPHHHLPPSSASPMMLEREALLNVSLDQQLVSLLVQCVTEFSEGRFTNLGCSLPSLLDWAWGRVTEIKTSNDNLCLLLFDPDCGVMNSENIALLHQNLTNLTTLATIITTIRDSAQSNLITLQGANELEGRVKVVRLMVLHLEAVLWFYHCGLLSPTPIEDPGDECCVPFPAELLSRIYRNRRSEIKNLSASLTGNEVLMIDGLLEEAAEVSGGNMGQAWEEEGGTSSIKSGGVYPPPSLHGLLNMFLLPYVPTTTKHRIVQYLFLDLASLLSDGYVRVVEELVKYPSSFSLSPSLIKLTQAFWLLDHKDFQEGLNVLLDPLVNPCDLTPWQHRRIMKAFLYQGEHGRALTYAKMRQPPKVDLDDIRLHLTLLLANKLVREAFHYQRAHRTTANTEDLLQHFFTGCEQQGRLESVIHLPLSPLEEAALVTYLRTSTSTSAHDYLLVYYLQRARYDDAALLQDSLRGGLGTARRRHGTRSALVHGYLTHLPDVASRLSSGVKRPGPPESIMYKKPPPLSAQIRQSSANIRSRASALEEQLGSPSLHTDPYTPFRSAAQRRRAYEKGDLDDYDILVTPRQKGSSRDASHVVFPSMETSPALFLEGETSGLFSLGPGRRSHLAESTHIGDGVIKIMESVLKRSSMHNAATPRKSMTQTISADMLSLLQTPKIRRKRRPDTRPGPDDTLTDTPQSILKVRQMVQRPLSPATASDASVPVFPRLSARKAKISAAAAAAVVEESALNRSADTSLTPKQLRFHLPKVQARAQLRSKGSAQLSADSDQLLEEEEVEEVEEEEAGEEEEMEEEEAVEEEEDEMEANTPELEEQVETDVEVTVPRLESERRQTGLGIPTPRQPLHGPATWPSTWPSQRPEKAMDMQGHESPAEVSLEEEESSEVPSKETTVNDMFYSFVEEEDEAEKANTEKDSTIEQEEVEMEDLEGVEISREIGETDDDLNTEDGDAKISEEEKQEDSIEGDDGKINEEKQEDSIEGDDGKISDEEKQEDSIEGDDATISEEKNREDSIEGDDAAISEENKQENSMPEDTSKMEKQDIELESVSGVNENGNIEKKDTEDEKTSQRPDKSALSLSDTLGVAAAEVEEEAEVLPTNQESLALEKDKEAPADFVPVKEQEYGLEERGEGPLREDEGFSEEIEPPHEEAQVPEEELEISDSGRSVIITAGSPSEEREVHVNQEDVEEKEEEEKVEQEQKGQEEKSKRLTRKRE